MHNVAGTRYRKSLVGLLSAGLLVAAAAPAQGATISVVTDGNGKKTAQYNAAGLGEINSVTAVVTNGARSVTFTDTVATLVAGTDCFLAGIRTVQCNENVGGFNAVGINLGDFDDYAAFDGGTERVPLAALGGPGNDQIIGGTGNDTIDGQGDDDILQAGGGDFNTLIGGLGNDQIAGGNGIDVINGDDPTAAPNNVNNTGNDVIYGNGSLDSINGGQGADQIFGGSGDDYNLFVGPTLQGGISTVDGNDVVHGDDGNDFITAGTASSFLFGDNGNDDIVSGAGAGGLAALGDRIYGGNGDDDVNAGTGNDEISGDGGHDRMFGNDGNDDIRGGAGEDEALGDNGNDTLSGDEGDDRLRGGAGNNKYFGGADTDDVNSANGVAETQISCGPGNDHLTRDAGDSIFDGSCENIFP